MLFPEEWWASGGKIKNEKPDTEALFWKRKPDKTFFFVPGFNRFPENRFKPDVNKVKRLHVIEPNETFASYT